MTIFGPPYQTAATLVELDDDRPLLSVLAKRTYTLRPDGRIGYAEQQLPLLEDAAFQEREDRLGGVPLSEPDIFPVKLATDVVVLGRVHTPNQRPQLRLRAGIAVGPHEKAIEVLGDRRVEYAAGRLLRFSPPQPFTQMELSWWRAYGGIDPAVPNFAPEDLPALMTALAPEDHPGAYPRNPCGTGYVVTEDRQVLDGLPLPNFEDPIQLLSPEHLAVGDPARWWQMPVPQGLSWFDAGWYPRATFAGLVPHHPPPDHLDAVREVAMGWIPRGQSARLAEASIETRIDPRLTNGAAPGLVLPHLRGDEPIRLVGLAPEGEIRFRLPGEQPDIRVRYEGRDLPIELFLHTVLIEPDARRFSLLWGARAPGPRVLLTRLPSPERPMLDLLEGFQIRVDGIELEHAPENVFE